MNRRTSGFTIVEAVLIIAVVGILGLLGWRVWAMTHPTTAAQKTTQASSSTITTTNDLKQTDTDLQNLSIDDNEASSLNTQASY